MHTVSQSATMRWTTPGRRRGSLLALALLALVVSLGASARAALINYGDSPVIPPGIKFLQVTESSGTDAVPLYGNPAFFPVGLDFNPTSFVSSASGGASDVTDGQLNFTIKGSGNGGPLVGINTLKLFEAGDYLLLGSGTTATQALAGVIIRMTVTEVDGVPVAPINLAPTNASVGFNLIANGGISQPWSLGLNDNINTLLTNAGVSYNLGATRIDVAINNTLATLSEPSSLAFIAKKEFQVTITGTPGVPEPTAAVSLGAFLLCGLSSRRRRNVGSN